MDRVQTIETFVNRDLVVSVTLWPNGKVDETRRTYDAWLSRSFVMQHMHWNGKYTSLVSNKLHTQCYLLCDGFGDAPEYYDWSHVRDSSDAALLRVADVLAIQKWGKPFSQLVQDNLDQAKDLGMSPLEFYY